MGSVFVLLYAYINTDKHDNNNDAHVYSQFLMKHNLFSSPSDSNRIVKMLRNKSR